MKLSDRNNALHFLLDGDPLRFTVDWRCPNVGNAVRLMKKEFPAMRPQFREKIQFVCSTFYEAYLKGREKLYNILFVEPVKQAGTFVIPIDGGETKTFFYDIETMLEDEILITNARVMIFAKRKGMSEPFLAFYAGILDNVEITYMAQNVREDGVTIDGAILDIIGLILFTRFCEVETKMVAPGKKVIHGTDKYFNETELDVEILDSTWFTNIVRTEGFMVGAETMGFFRWQAVGPGRAERKLIWVAPFEKKGYSRKAGVLGGREENNDRSEHSIFGGG